jgi:tetratricopeptide (TPR) repeat protein
VIAARAESKGRDVEWMGEACKPKLAAECYHLAWGLKGEGPSHSYEAAIKLLKRSLSLELTEEDIRRFSASMAAPPRVDMGLLLRAGTEELLAECYQKTGRADLAQPLVEKLAKLEIDGMPLEMLRLAGQVQAETGQRVVEGMVMEREEPSADSPEYWLDRAEYFMGRKEDEGVREAFEKALALCSRERPEDSERGAPMRLRGVNRYVWYLRREGAFGDAAGVLRSELGQAPAGSELARRAMWLLSDMDGNRQYTIEPGDELLWSALASMAVWDRAEARVLSCMVAKAGREGRDEVIGRAEGLCRGAHPSRAQQLGEVCRRVAPERAVVLLRDAEARLEDEQERGWLSALLFDVYVELGWVEEAERQFAVALPRWALEGPAQLARVAQVAAEKGDDAGAMRLWRRVANMDGTYLEPLPKLEESGLRERLRGFYEEWRESDPESWIPEAALGLL